MFEPTRYEKLIMAPDGTLTPAEADADMLRHATSLVKINAAKIYMITY